MSALTVMDDALYADLVEHRLPFEEYLFLEPHPQLKRQWRVEGDDPTFSVRLDGAISRFGTVSVWNYDHFAEVCETQGYVPVFMEDPGEIFDWKASLNADPGVTVDSKLDGRLDRTGKPLRLINGFLPFQAVGINFMRSCGRCVYFQWSTGTGKTLAAEGTILVKRESGYGREKTDGFDLCLYVVKPNNLYNTRKKLIQHTGLDARILAGTPKRRERLFGEAEEAVQAEEQPILIFNAEKFREDTEFFKALVTDRNVLVIFDEMPEKYANRGTALYRATAEVFYTSFAVSGQGNKKKTVYYPNADKNRTKQSFFVGMCATPIRNAPEDFFNCIRLMDSRIYGSINDFNNRFVAARDRWHNVIRWQNLDLFGAMAAHVVHQADKRKDPEIAAQFPEKLPPEVDYCDMDGNSEKLYGALQAEYQNIGASMLDFDEILAAISVFQMICNNPRSVLDSARKYEAYMEKYQRFLTVELPAQHVVDAVDTSKGWKAVCSCGWEAKEDNKTTFFPAQKNARLSAQAHRQSVIKEFERKYRDGSEVALKLVQKVDNDAKFTDQDGKGKCVIAKMLTLRDRIEQHEGKVIVFSSANQTLLPYIAEWFDEWGISYVPYHGGLSAKQKQETQDAFRTDPSVKVFLSTDAGKDSIDLPEADLTIHYDEPWTWAGREQRENRQDRIDSDKLSVQTITLRTPFTVEDRKMEIIETKKGYHDKIFGNSAISDQADELTKSDFLYILTGQRD